LYKRASIYGGRASADGPIVSRMTEKCDNASNAYAMEHSRSTRGLAKGSASPMENVTKRDPEDEGEDELALLGGYTRVIKASKDSASPSSLAGPAPARHSPAQRNVSPVSTDTSSVGAEQHRQWEGMHSAFGEYPNITGGNGHGSSPSGDTTDLHMSSEGSPSSGRSPEAGIPLSVTPVHQESYTQNGLPRKSFETRQLPMEIQYQGVPSYDDGNGLPEHDVRYAAQSEVVRIAGEPAIPQHQTHYAPMEVSTGGYETREWNFLDNWYGHVFQLDVIPPDYGK